METLREKIQRELRVVGLASGARQDRVVDKIMEAVEQARDERLNPPLANC